MEHIEFIVQDLEDRITKILAEISILLGKEVTLPEAKFTVPEASKEVMLDSAVVEAYRNISSGPPGPPRES